MTERLSRREALRRVGTATLVLGGASAIARAAWDQGEPGKPQDGTKPQLRDFRLHDQDKKLVDLAVASQATDAAALTRAAIEALGGMKRFVSPGETVCVKPNIGWDRTPVHAANTNPLVVAEVVRLALAARASKVIVSDASCNDSGRSFQRSGIWKAAHDAGAHVIVPADHHFRDMRLGGEVLGQWPVLRPLVSVDKVINVPVAKHHNLAKYTGAMKNWYGLLGGRRNRLHQSIDISIADLATFMQPTLTVIDATRVLMRNGPQGGNIADTKDMHTVIASVDQVAADAYACGLVGVKPEQLKYVVLGHQRGLGTMHWHSLRHVKV